MDYTTLVRPDHGSIVPRELWTEILPNLWLGGTADHDTERQLTTPMITRQNFDTVVTLYAWANPTDWFVREVRFGFYDADVIHLDTDELHDLVAMAHRDWKAGRRVLIRCQAGLNRSGLVMALVLVRDGHSPEEAMSLMRQRRSRHVLCNGDFERWLRDLDPQPWRAAR